MYENLFDSHTHSENTIGGEDCITVMMEAAVEKGLHGLSITDSCECDRLEELDYKSRIRHSVVDIAIAKAAFRGRVILTTGIELSQPAYNQEAAAEMLRLRRYDFVLLSLHRLRGYDDFADIDYIEMPAERLHAMMEQYFQELLELCGWGRFDTLAHLGYPARFPFLKGGIKVDLRRYSDHIDAVLRALVESDKGLELNVADLFTPLKDTIPTAWILQRFKELGGEIVTIGSDARRAEDIGLGVAEGMDLLQGLGYRDFAFYRQGKPLMLRIQ